MISLRKINYEATNTSNSGYRIYLKFPHYGSRQIYSSSNQRLPQYGNPDRKEQN